MSKMTQMILLHITVPRENKNIFTIAIAYNPGQNKVDPSTIKDYEISSRR